MGEQPLKSQDGKTVGKMSFYFLSSDDANAPKNMLTITEMDRSQNTSPDMYVANHARALQQQCESLQVSRPAHLLERRVAVSYARLYCMHMKGKEEGFVQTVKALQGKDRFFMVAREWSTPVFSLATPITDREQLARSIFGPGDQALNWLSQFDSANNFLAQAVTLCSNNPGEFGDTCPSK
jgi:hypothetical protein